MQICSLRLQFADLFHDLPLAHKITVNQTGAFCFSQAYSEDCKYNICVFVHHTPQSLRGKEGRLCTSCITFEEEMHTKRGHNLLAPSGWHLDIMT